MGCILRNNKGEVLYAEATNGNRSNLFDTLQKQNPNNAEDLYLVTATQEFKEEVVKPKIMAEKERIRSLFQPQVLTTPIQNKVSLTFDYERSDSVFRQNYIMLDGERVGDFNLLKDDGVWVVDMVAINKEFQKQGYGKEAYRIANNSIPKGEGVLHSSGFFEGQAAKNVWRSLVRSGEAIEIGKNAWKFKESQDVFLQETPKDNVIQPSTKVQGYNQVSRDGATIHFKDGNIELLETAPESRGQGAARRLLEDFVKLADVNRQTLRLMVAPREKGTTEVGLVKLYQSVGFEGTQFEMVRYPQPLRQVEGLDNNLEPSVKDLYDYINKKNIEAVEVTPQDRINIIKAMVGYNTSDQLLTSLKKAFYNNKGQFAPTKTSLKRNGYTETEAQAILSDLELQAQIKDNIQKIEALEEPIIIEDSEIPAYNVVESMQRNFIGKYSQQNPYIVEKQVIAELGGIKDKNTFEEALVDSEIEIAKDSFEELSQYTETQVLNENLEPKPANNTAELLEETLTAPSTPATIVSIQTVLNLRETIATPQQVETLLQDLKIKAVDLGIDLSNIQEMYTEKGLVETQVLAQRLLDFAAVQNENTFNALVETYNRFFNIDTQAVQTIKLKGLEDSDVYVESGTKMAAEMFVENGLLYKGGNIFKRVNNRKTVEETYDIVATRTELFPQNIFEGVNMTNTARVKDVIKNYVDGQIKNIETPEQGIDTDNLHKFYLNSLFFQTPVNKEVVTKDITNLIDNPIETNYLSTQYIADFYKKTLLEKHKNSEAYKDYYSNFSITPQGIEMINTDPISQMLAKEYMDEAMRDYLKVKKDSQIEIQEQITENFTDETLVNRNFYSNFAEALPKFTKTFIRISETQVFTKDAAQEFIRLNDGVYEQIEDGYYSKIPTNNSNYIQILNVAPQAAQRLNTPNSIEAVQQNNLYNQKESEQLDKQLECL